MGKQYSYPKWAVGAYGLLVLFPLVAWFFLFKIRIQDLIGVFVFSNIFLFAITATIVLWAINLSKTKIQLNDKGLTYKSLARHIIIKWDDISDIKRKYLYGGRGQYGGPPRDIEIRTRDGKTIKVLSILASIDGGDMEEGIQDFEAELKRYTKMEF